ncbi:MAG: nucleotidyltransferase domain-containing protein [Clostridiales bacterium]|nr:nucleotidyltransferase domain-containing protein [Clostridiales bacterium]
MVVIPDKIQLPDRFLNKLKNDIDVINHYDLDLVLVILFGSCAKNKITIESDLDLMFVTEDKIDFHLKKEIQDIMLDPLAGVKTDAVFYTMDELRYGTSRFVLEVKKYGRVVWEK